MWNFVGRQNDLEGKMENTRGNWISGISFIDNALLGNQDKMPTKFKNESTVKFFFLPLILGLMGFFFPVEQRLWKILCPPFPIYFDQFRNCFLYRSQTF
ncbi:Uncharacterised protein [Chryseobacterium carnipullorum]|uniref:Uncharacterized protein n=1 Tax=Chryseobacterium carnipullorum TaxID=1124835 RepID=A0A376E2L8_CHRCU|nr:Uncharacterised protein [Chryseobacterium carnipullorum]